MSARLAARLGAWWREASDLSTFVVMLVAIAAVQALIIWAAS